MDDETNALLYMAGTANWHHTIAPTRINMGNNTIITNINTALQGAQGPRATEFNLNALTGLQAAANILANKIADTIYIANALDIFREACITANKLNKEATVPHPAFQPSFKKAMTATRILNDGDPLALSMLLVDIIRIANHPTHGKHERTRHGNRPRTRQRTQAPQSRHPRRQHAHARSNRRTSPHHTHPHHHLKDTINTLRECVEDAPERTLEHLTHVARGGTHDIDNLDFAHYGCNSSKGAKTLEEYREWQDKMQQAS